MRWVGHVTCRGRSETHARYLSENLKGRNYSGNLGVNGRIVLK
jgi:hypothetical protein